jgi:hypothetical protein
MVADDVDPETYVREHREELIEVIKHGDDAFVRGIAIAAILEFGDDPDVDELVTEIERHREQRAQEGSR